MRPIIIPDDDAILLVGGLLLVVVAGIVVYRWLRPPVVQKLLGDDRYRRGLEHYLAGLPAVEEPTWEQRHDALDAAAQRVAADHGLAVAEAAKNLRVLIAEYDRDRSYELRLEAAAYEQAGAFDLALELYERAARLRQEHDVEDHAFLMRCADRVRGRSRLWKDR